MYKNFLKLIKSYDGFTLMEIIVAMLIAAIAMTALTSSFMMILSQTKQQTIQSENLMDVQLVQRYMDQEIRQARRDGNLSAIVVSADSESVMIYTFSPNSEMNDAADISIPILISYRYIFDNNLNVNLYQRATSFDLTQNMSELNFVTLISDVERNMDSGIAQPVFGIVNDALVFQLAVRNSMEINIRPITIRQQYRPRSEGAIR